MSGVPWSQAWREALYGPSGFYRRTSPAAHFRTSVLASGLYAGAIASLAAASGLRKILDVGSGRGELLVALARIEPSLELAGVDVVPRPADLPPSVQWQGGLPARIEGTLVVANEWLDDVPCDVVQVRGGEWVAVLVEPLTGAESLGEPVSGGARAWLERWWPLGVEGDRAEVGLGRDRVWADLVARLDGSIGLAVDYAHSRADRAAGLHAGGTLAGWRDGRRVVPVPDGSCNVTAAVALDACAAAGVTAGATSTRLITQGEALGELGVSGQRPPLSLARHDPTAYARQLVTAGEAAELTDPPGLGGFGWLVQAVGLDRPRHTRAVLCPPGAVS